MSPQKSVSNLVENWIEDYEKYVLLKMDHEAFTYRERIFAIEMLCICLKWKRLEQKLEKWREKNNERI